MKNDKIVIGALVGMGPNSTGFFYDQVMDYARKLYGAKDDNDFPHVILYSLPTPFLPNQKIDNEAMLSALAIGIQALNLPELGVDYLVIPCNIVQHYYETLSAISRVPILNLVEIIIKNLATNIVKPGTVALIATHSTINNNIFQPYLAQAGYSVLHNLTLQTHVDVLLQELKANKLSALSQQLWQSLINYLDSEGCKTMLIACTDISPCLELRRNSKINVIDSCKVLAHATIEHYMLLTNKQS